MNQKPKILKGYFLIETDNNTEIVKAKNMKEAVYKFVGNLYLKYLSEVTYTEHYCSFLLNYPKDNFFSERRELIRARTMLYKS